MDEEQVRSGNRLGSVLCVPFSALKHTVGHLAHNKTCYTNSHKFSCVIRGGGEPEVKAGDPGLHKKQLLNGSSSASSSNSNNTVTVYHIKKS